MTTDAFFVAASTATIVSAFGIVDAWLTWLALSESAKANDPNARLLAKGGIRTAALRTLQMGGLTYAASIAIDLTPRPATAAALEHVWIILAAVCLVSAAKELLAMWDRRHIVPDVTPPEGWTP